MKLKNICAGGAVGLLLFAFNASAFDFGVSTTEGEQCLMSDLLGEYNPPDRMAQAPTEVIAGESIEKAASDMASLHAWLSANRGEIDHPAFTIELSRQDLLDIGAFNGAQDGSMRNDPRRVQVGVDKPLGIDLDFSALTGKPITVAGQPHMGGVVSKGLDGEMVWTALAQSPGATALRIGIEDLNLPKGAELYVYSEKGQAFGPYTGRGPNNDGVFWSSTLFGEQVTLQLHYFGKRDADAMLNLGFRIASLVHIGPRFPLRDFVDPERIGDKAYCSYNESCVEPASSSGSAPVADAKNAVALMIFSSRGAAYICSGGLLADTDTGSVINYFLTANHCINKGREASSLETFFDFDTDCGDQYAQNGSYPGTNGSSIKSANRTGDYTLLELNQTPGGSRAYLGWDNTPVAFSPGTQLYRISHPSGAPQAFSHHEVNTKGTCSSWPRGNWIYSDDLFGATEGGSSGSPVLNGAGLVVGQLSGGCGTNVNDVCDTVSNSTVDGALAAYWGSVEEFLDPSGTPPPGGDETVSSVSVSISTQGPWNRAVATVVIVDGGGSPVANATVSGSFSGDASGSGSGTTDASGVTTITSNRQRAAMSSVTFCVSTVNGSTATGNTCGSN